MLPAEALAALDRLPSKEALRRPLKPENTAARRTAKLLAGDDVGAASMTVGDALFRWARVEPEGLADANVTELHRISDMLAAAGRIPRRFGLAAEARRSTASITAISLNDVSPSDDNPFFGTARTYLIQRLVAHLFDAQGCEAHICGAEADPKAILLNGLQAVVHDPLDAPPTRLNRVTFVTQDLAGKLNGFTNNPLVYALIGMESGTLERFHTD